MKSVSQQICETQDLLIASGKFDIEKLKEATKDSVCEEHRLSTLKSLARKNNIAESRPRIARNNGSGSFETGSNRTERMTEQLSQVSDLVRSYGLGFKEACAHAGLKDVSESDMTKALVEAWQTYLPSMSLADAQSLAEKGILPR